MTGTANLQRCAAKRLARLALTLLVLGGVACQGPPLRQATPEERAAFGEALSPLPQDPSVARGRLLAFLDTYPASPLADDAGEKLAVIETSLGRPEEAEKWLRWVLREQPRGDRTEAARLGLAGMARDRGDDAAARRLFADAQFDRMTAAQRVVAYRMLADLAPTELDRLRWLAELYRVSPGARARARVAAEIDASAATLGVEPLGRLLTQLGSRPPAARLTLRLAERALEAGDVEETSRLLARVDALTLTESDLALQRALVARLSLREAFAEVGVLPTFAEVSQLPLPNTAGATGTIGVVLPLSGAFARFGEESLRGIALAAGVFDEIDAVAAENEEGERVPPAPSVRLIVRDSAGSPARAAAAVEELAAIDEVVAILGPLLAAEAEAAARAAETAGVPLLTLTSREDVAAEREGVFRLRTTPDDEVSFLVDHAVDELGAERFAVLYPADTYGRGMRDRFWEAVEARGGYMVAASGYAPDATDFAKPIRSMIGYALLTPLEREAVAEREAALKRARRLPPEEAVGVREVILGMLGPGGEPLPPIVDFDALFIPDAHDKVVLIAPQLAFHDVSGVRLLGSSGWVHEDLTKVGRGDVRRAVMAALFHPESPYPFVAEFVEGFGAHFDAVPDVFAASAYDAANLVLVQLAAGHDARDPIAKGISSVRGYPGASGVTSFLPDGNARKRPFLLGVQGRRLVALD